ncbi:MAG: DNA polymerase III subunit gamma/tau, partial [Chloroflexota bacterium]
AAFRPRGGSGIIARNMASEVLYRKWRPQSLEEVVGQEAVTRTLREAVRSGRVAHAYLFCGPRGTGKTSTGRILAKAVNCPNVADGEPCGTCEICRSIAEGRCLDVVEIDAASNRGIDEIRSLREKVNYSPSLARYKVYITDEVHMLTEAASNALLKTLEEPPRHVIFILATTEPHKVLPTIMSRCQRFNFSRLAQGAIEEKLGLICEREGVTAEPESLRLVARAATGSLRDAENTLQQLLTHHGTRIDAGEVRASLGLTEDSRVKQLALEVVKGDISGGLATISGVNRDGVDLRQFTLELNQHLRNLLLVKSGCEGEVDMTGEDLADMREAATGVTMEQLLGALRLFSAIDFRGEGYSTLPLELALVECALSHRDKAGEEVVGAPVVNEQPERSAETPEAAEDTVPPPEGQKEEMVADVSGGTPEATGEAVSEAGGSRETEEEAGTQADREEGAGSDFQSIRGRWRELVESLRGEGSTGNLDAFLRSACEPIDLEGDVLVLGFYYTFHKEKIEDPKYKFLVERKLQEVFGRAYKIRCVLTRTERKKRSSEGKHSPLVQAALEMGAELQE